MKHYTLGSDILDISAVSFGTTGLGTEISEADSFRLMDAYLDMGGNFIDTARVYSDWVPGETGRCERIIGDWMAARRNRSRVVLATKGAHPRLGSMHTARMSKAEVEEDLRLSLKALRTDAIDLYYLHRDDSTRPVEEILLMLEGFVKAGMIRRYACSNWRADRMLEAHAAARANGFMGFAANQVFWSLGSALSHGLADDTCVAFDEALEDAFRKTGILAAAYTSQAGGYFTKLEQGREVSGMFDTPGNLRVYDMARAIASETGMTMTALTLQYILSQPIPAVAVVGCKTMEQLADTMAGADQELQPERLSELETVINR